MPLRVDSFMTDRPVTVEAEQNAVEAARKMKAHGVSFLIVLSKGRVVGVLTASDIATRVLADGSDPVRTRVSRVMTTEPHTVTIDDDIFDVMDALKKAGPVRRLPVVTPERELVGVVSVSDLAVALRSLMDAVLGEDMRHALKAKTRETGGKKVRRRVIAASKVDRPRIRIDPTRRP